MGKIKAVLYDMAEAVAKLIKANTKPDEIDIDMRNMLGEDMFELYIDNLDIIHDMAYDMAYDEEESSDETWTDPAGGVHAPGEDPLSMYESMDNAIFMKSIEDFE